MEKIITIDGIDVPMKISGATYLKFRNEFHEDMFKKLQSLNDIDGEIGDDAINTLLQIAYIMARQATPTMTDSFEDWLDQFSFTGAINDALLGVLSMVNNDQVTIDEAKKKSDQPNE